MAVAEGSVGKWCTCAGPDGRRLYARCPKLRRRGGPWSATHGLWMYNLELPSRPDGGRRQMRRIPAARLNSRETAVAERDHARAMVALAGADEQRRRDVATLLQRTRSGRPLPDQATVLRCLQLADPDRADLTVGEYLREWAETRPMDLSTRRTYAGHIRNHLIPHLGTIRLAGLRRVHVEDMIATIIDRNHQLIVHAAQGDLIPETLHGHQHIAVATMHSIRATLRKALNDAIRDGLLAVNAAAQAVLPPLIPAKALVWTDARVARWQATGTVPSSVMVWTPEQSGRFLDHVQICDPDLYPVFLLVIHRGTRRGEAAGLSTGDVDLTINMVSISHQLTTPFGSPVYKSVKTVNGIRDTVLDRRLSAALTVYQQRRDALRQAAGDQWPESVPVTAYRRDRELTVEYVDLFFRQPNGQAWHPATLSARFAQYAKEAGLPPCGVHDGRHASATYTKAAGGTLTDIKEQLGLADIDTADKVYVSLLDDGQRHLAEATSALIPRAEDRLANPGPETDLTTAADPAARLPSPTPTAPQRTVAVGLRILRHLAAPFTTTQPSRPATSGRSATRAPLTRTR